MPRRGQKTDCFPAELINVTDLRVTRPTSTGSWGDDVAGAATVVLDRTEAIIERRSDILRTSDNEEIVLFADIWIRPPGLDSVVQEKDRASWTDFYGTVAEEEIFAVLPAQIGDDGTFEVVRLRIGRRS